MTQLKKSLAIWMDFSIAYLMEYSKNEVSTYTIKSGNFLLIGKNKSLLDSNRLNLPNQDQLSIYYRKISDYIIDFDEVTLFGPSGAKNELFELLLLNPHFDNINMSVRDTGRLNNHERESLIRTNAFRTVHTFSSFLVRENPCVVESSRYLISVV